MSETMNKHLHMIRTDALSADCLGFAEKYIALARKYQSDEKRSEFYKETAIKLGQIGSEASLMSIEYQLLHVVRNDERRLLQNALVKIGEQNKTIEELEKRLNKFIENEVNR